MQAMGASLSILYLFKLWKVKSYNELWGAEMEKFTDLSSRLPLAAKTIVAEK
jgi:hypothetical protein